MSIRAPVTDPPEVRCSRCRVSFPPEVKRCIHCGERTQRPQSAPALRRREERRLRELEPFIVGEPPPGGGRESAPRPLEPEVDEGELEHTGRGPLRLISALVWILLALGGGLYRACNS